MPLFDMIPKTKRTISVLLEYFIMNKSITSIFLCILSLSIQSCSTVGTNTNSNIVKILPLGDSITCASKYKVSYRYPLWKQLIDAGGKIQYVGSQTEKGNGGREWDAYKNTLFPPANEGHSGWRADQILHGLKSGEKGLSNWLVNYKPDIVLIHLGTNDLYQKQTPESTRDDIHNIINKLRSKNPRIKILLAEIIPLRKNTAVIRLNQLLAKLAKEINQPSSPVISVDMYSGFNLQTDMQKDRIHPNTNGEIKMAQQWFKALMNQKMLGSSY